MYAGYCNQQLTLYIYYFIRNVKEQFCRLCSANFKSCKVKIFSLKFMPFKTGLSKPFCLQPPLIFSKFLQTFTVKIINTLSCVFVYIIQWQKIIARHWYPKPVQIYTCVSAQNSFVNTLFAFAFTAASTSSAVGLLSLLFDFFNQLSID